MVGRTTKRFCNSTWTTKLSACPSVGDNQGGEQRRPQVARQHQNKRLSRTFVATREETPENICGYYALTLAELDKRHLPDARRKKLPNRIPGVRLARLAVARQHQGKGLGELLLIDALARTRRIHAEGGGIGLFVDAIDEAAVAYYRKFGFEPSPDNSLLLFFLAAGTQ